MGGCLYSEMPVCVLVTFPRTVYMRTGMRNKKLTRCGLMLSCEDEVVSLILNGCKNVLVASGSANIRVSVATCIINNVTKW